MAVDMGGAVADAWTRLYRWLTGRCARCGALGRVAAAGAATDLHSRTAAQHGWCRACAKIHNHAVAYGMARSWQEIPDRDAIRPREPR